MKQLNTNNLQIIKTCQENFGFRLHGESITIRTNKLESTHSLLEYK